MGSDDMSEWRRIEDSPFVDANGVMGFSVTCGWQADLGTVPQESGTPIVSITLACVTAAQREAGVVVTDPEEFTSFHFLLFAQIAADVAAGIIAAGMKVSPSFMNDVMDSLVGQGIGALHQQVEELLGGGEIPENGAGMNG